MSTTFRAPDRTTGWALIGVGVLVGFLATNFLHLRKEAECNHVADSYIDANKVQRALVFAECFNPRKYRLRP